MCVTPPVAAPVATVCKALVTQSSSTVGVSRSLIALVYFSFVANVRGGNSVF